MYRSVEAYVADLGRRLRVGHRARRRIEQEVTAHLAELVAEEEAAGLTPQAATRRAAARFGAAEALAAEFNRDAAGHLLRRSSWAMVVCVGVAFAAAGAAVQGWGPAAAWPGDSVFGLVSQVMVQVAGVCALNGLFLVVAAPWIRRVPLGGRSARHAGWSVALAAAALVPVAVVAAGNVARTAVPGERVLLAVVAVAVPVAAVGAWRAAARADLLGEGADGDATTLDVMIGCCEALATRADWSARWYQEATALWAHWAGRAPGVARWFELRRHPWRTAVSVSAAAGVALKLPDLVLKGDVDLPAAAIEAVAVFVSYLLLGGLLGLRTARGGGLEPVMVEG